MYSEVKRRLKKTHQNSSPGNQAEMCEIGPWGECSEITVDRSRGKGTVMDCPTESTD